MINLEKYRDKWLARNVDEFIGFYPREFFCFDNFSAFSFIYDGIRFHTVEHAYQAYKFKNTAPEIFNEIVNCFSSDEARRIAHRNEDKVVANWDDIKLDFMEKFLRTKLEQNLFVKKKLLETKDYLICEDSPIDSFWGIGEDKRGRNELGKIWMKLRAELQENKEQNELLGNKRTINKVVIYTDGACSGNPGVGGWGAVLFHGENMKEISGYAENTTNNQMELTAAIMALDKLKVPCDVELYSDSAYLINAFNEGWITSWQMNGFKNASKKPVANVELWQKLIEFNNTHKITWIKVKGHADNKYNNRCDELATGEISKHQN